MTAQSFLPGGYKTPVTAKYMKFADGKNRFRILSPAITGNEFWIKEKDDKGKEKKKPVRRRLNEDLNLPGNVDGKVKHFWAFIVWNVNDEVIQILQITQKTIQGAIEALCNSPDWGDPMDYDIVITRQGADMDTTYQTTPIPPQPVDQEILGKLAETPIKLDALFEGKDPFDDSNIPF